MEYTRLRTSLLVERLSDQDILAISKYQMLCAYLEESAPPEKIVLRFLKPKQYALALQYYDSINGIVCADIRAINLKRGCDRKTYRKNKDKPQIQMELPPNEKSPRNPDGFPGIKLPTMK
jgi:hypothetical protein